MIQGSLRQGIAVEDGTQLLLAGVVGVALGLSFAYVPATYVAITIVALFILVVAIRSPQYALIVILFVLSTLFGPESFPRLSFGGIHIWITDLIIIGLFGLIAVRLLIDRSYKMLHSPITIPLILFLVWSLYTAMKGYYDHNSIRGDMVIETRIVLYNAIAICVMYLIRSEKNINILLKWFYFLSVVAAIMILVQFGLGVQVSFLTSGKIYSFATTGGPVVARVQGTVGEGLVTIALILKTITLFVDRLHIKKVYDLLQWLILAAGLICTFNRTHWIMVFVAILITMFLVGGKGRRQIFSWGLIVIFVGLFLGTLAVVTQPNSRAASLITAGVGRVSTIFQESSYTDPKESTILWRSFEYKYGLPQIYKNPIFGIGLGSQYRPTLLNVDYVGFQGELYSHNSNLWIAMKTGLVGFLFFLWFSFAFIWHTLSKWRSIPSIPHRDFVLGSGIAVLVCLFGANIHPFWMTLEWIPVFAIIIGLSEAIILYYSAKTEK